MLIRGREDSAEVEERIGRGFGEPPAGRAAAIRQLSVEALECNAAGWQASLDGASAAAALPAATVSVRTVDIVASLPRFDETIARLEMEVGA